MARFSSPRNVYLDHFYNDEAETDPTLPKKGNRFHFKESTFQIDQADSDNPIEAAEQTKLKQPVRKEVDTNYYIFVPPKTRAAAEKENKDGEKLTVMVSLLFALRDQFNRAGLRHYFAERDDAVLITVPGRELAAGQTPWGIGISDAQIESLLKKAFGKTTVLYEIAVLAAYSTGYRGMQGTILENAKKKFITLTHVKKMIYYDCLYKGDGTPGGYPPGEQTADAVNALLAASPAAKLSIYEVTDGGTKRYGKSLAVNVSGQNLINLKPLARELTTLQYARLLDEAKRDGIIADKDVPASIKALLPLPDRGEIASDKQFITVGTKVLLQGWANSNAAAVSKAQADLSKIDRIIYDEWLMGWRPAMAGDVRAEALHDQFVPEFAWELLPP
jgi:hypothetical protein